MSLSNFLFRHTRRASTLMIAAMIWGQALANPLATEEQIRLEKLAVSVFESAPVRKAREEARALLLADPTAQTLDGAVNLDRALDQWVMGQVAATINSDPARPRLFWAIDNAPRKWFGHVFPGAAVAIDNPDNVNRTTPLDGAHSYVLRGRLGTPKAGQTSINVVEAKEGQLRIGKAIATMTDRDLETDAAGRFTVTMDPTPAGGRSNHIQLPAGPLQLSIRDSRADWRQEPTMLEIEVVDGPKPGAAPSEQQLERRTAAGVQAFVRYWLGFKNEFWNNPVPNTLVGPNLRKSEGGWGAQAGGRFSLRPDEVLLVTTTSGGAEYTGFQISDPWTISPTPIYLTTSRNTSQAAPNPDGTYTYAVAAVDPGIANWIDTAGLHEGWFMLRWQNLPKNVDVTTLVRRFAVVKFGELGTSVDETVPRADLAHRRKEIRERIRQHEEKLRVATSSSGN